MHDDTNEQSIGRLIEHLDSESAELQASSSAELRHRSSEQVVAALMNGLGRDEPRVRRACVVLLVGHRHLQAVQRLASMVVEDPADNVRVACAWALWEWSTHR